jgi:hypothetical protein
MALRQAALQLRSGFSSSSSSGTITPLAHVLDKMLLCGQRDEGGDQQEAQPANCDHGKRRCWRPQAANNSQSHAAAIMLTQTRGMAFWGWGKQKSSSPQGNNAAAPPELTFVDDANAVQQAASSAVSDVGEGAVPAGAEQLVVDSAAAITAACASLETSAVQAAQEQSILLGAQFISAVQAVHTSVGLPWCALACQCKCLRKFCLKCIPLFCDS